MGSAIAPIPSGGYVSTAQLQKLLGGVSRSTLYRDEWQRILRPARTKVGGKVLYDWGRIRLEISLRSGD